MVLPQSQLSSVSVIRNPSRALIDEKTTNVPLDFSHFTALPWDKWVQHAECNDPRKKPVSNPYRPMCSTIGAELLDRGKGAYSPELAVPEQALTLEPVYAGNSALWKSCQLGSAGYGGSFIPITAETQAILRTEWHATASGTTFTSLTSTVYNPDTRTVYTNRIWTPITTSTQPKSTATSTT
jgi:hypothetical protein